MAVPSGALANKRHKNRTPCEHKNIQAPQAPKAGKGAPDHEGDTTGATARKSRANQPNITSTSTTEAKRLPETTLLGEPGASLTQDEETAAPVGQPCCTRAGKCQRCGGHPGPTEKVV